MIIQQVDVEKIRPLRSLVLRPGQPIDSTNYEKDNEILTLHYANIINKKVCSIATFYPEPMIELNAFYAYRLRGMATHPIYDIKNLGGDLIWCRARLVAIDFYQSIGFLKIGPIYEIEGIGPHYTMYKYL